MKEIQTDSVTQGTLTRDRPQTPCLLYPSSLCRGRTPEARRPVSGARTGRRERGCTLATPRSVIVGRAVLQQSSLMGEHIVKSPGQQGRQALRHTKGAPRGSEDMLSWGNHRGQGRAPTCPKHPGTCFSPHLPPPLPSPAVSGSLPDLPFRIRIQESKQSRGCAMPFSKAARPSVKGFLCREKACPP